MQNIICDLKAELTAKLEEVTNKYTEYEACKAVMPMALAAGKQLAYQDTLKIIQRLVSCAEHGWVEG